MPIHPKKLEAFANPKKKPRHLDEEDEEEHEGEDHEHASGEHEDEDTEPGHEHGGHDHEEDEHDHHGGGKPGGGHEHGEDGGGEKHVDVQKIGARVQSGNGDKRLMKLSKGIDEHNNPPQWVEDEDIWEKAKDAVEPHWDEYDEPYAVVTHVYQQMGGSIGGGQ